MGLVQGQTGTKSTPLEPRTKAGERGAAFPERAGCAVPVFPSFHGTFSFANELPGSPNGFGTGKAAESRQPLPTPEADVFPSKIPLGVKPDTAVPGHPPPPCRRARREG